VLTKTNAWIAALLLMSGIVRADLPDGYLGQEQSQAILDNTQRITLDPDLSHLSGNEFQVVEELLAAGRIMQKLYELQLHRDAPGAADQLAALNSQNRDSREVQNLLDLYYLFKGPIATTLENARIPIMPVSAEQPGKNVYPYGVTKGEIDAFLAAHPDKALAISDPRSVVRRASAENIAADLELLDHYPVIEALHGDLRARLESETLGEDLFYALPYALAYAPQLSDASQHLMAASRLARADSADFAAYLENRARDLLSNNYESGDAAWVSGDFANLNIQIGSYETYDDALLGAKTFFSASILARDVARSDALATAMMELQQIEDSLPYEHHKRVRQRIPVGVYRVIADFGQARGSNTATILPNDADYTRKYGRTILIRYNILSNPALVANTRKLFDAAVHARYREDYIGDGAFNRTLWHEVGHYLGPASTADGRTLAVALTDKADLFEELKSDLVSLFAVPALHSSGYLDDRGLRAQYADGIRRTLQTVKPRPDQPYQNMQLMQFNFYMELGLLEPDAASGTLLINFDRYHDVVSQMLEQVLQIQYAGDQLSANEFVARWNYWDEQLHGRLAQQIRNSGAYHRTLVRYHALGD